MTTSKKNALIFLISLLLIVVIVACSVGIPMIIQSVNFSKSGGSISIKYVNQNDEEISETGKREKLELNQTYIEEAKSIEGYVIVGDFTTSVTLTKDSPNAEIIFKYDYVSDGSIVVKYVDIDGGEIAPSKEIKSIKYQTEYVEKAVVFEDYVLRSSLDFSYKLTLEQPSLVVVFVYDYKYNGAVTIKYIDVDNNEISEPKTIKNLKTGQKYRYDAIEINGFFLVSDSVVEVELTDENSNREIIFIYANSKSYSAAKVRNVDSVFKDLTAPKIVSIAKDKTREIVAAKIDGYAIVGEDKVVVSFCSKEQEVIFKHAKTTTCGTINIKYVDLNGANISAPETKQNVELGVKNNISYKHISGYTLHKKMIDEKEQQNLANEEVSLSFQKQVVDITFVYRESSYVDSEFYVIDNAKKERFSINDRDTNASAETNLGIKTENAKNNTYGLNMALMEASSLGYKKVKLMPGTYLIKGEYYDKTFQDKVIIANDKGDKMGFAVRGIYIPANLEVDFTDCIFEQVANEKHPLTSMLSFLDSHNSIVIGGTFIGDKYTHYYGTRINEKGGEFELGAIASNGENVANANTVRTKNFITEFINQDGTKKAIKGGDWYKVVPLWNTTGNTTIYGGSNAVIHCYDATDKYLGVAKGGNTYVTHRTLLDNTAKIKITLGGEKRTDAVIAITEEPIWASFESGNCISIMASDNVQVVGMMLRDATGDCITTRDENRAAPYFFSRRVDDLKVVECVFDGSRRQGISFCGAGKNALLKNVVIKNIAGVDPQCGIDFESYSYNDVQDTVIDGCTFFNNKQWDIVNYNAKGIEIKNCRFYGGIGTNHGNYMDIHDNHFEYDDSQDKIWTYTGLNISTNNIKVYNNHFKSARVFMPNDAGSALYGNVFEDCLGDAVSVTHPYANKYINSKIAIETSDSYTDLEGIECIDSTVIVGGSPLRPPLKIRYSTFENCNLECRGTSIFENVTFKGTNDGLKKLFDGNSAPNEKRSFTFNNCIIDSPNVPLALAIRIDMTFNDCDITVKWEEFAPYGLLAFNNCRVQVVADLNDARTELWWIKTSTPNAYFNNSMLIVPEAPKKTHIYLPNSNKDTNTFVGQIRFWG